MNTIQKLTDKHEKPESLQKKVARNSFFKVRSDVKVGFELTASVDFNKIAQSVSGMIDSVKSIYSDGF